MAGKARRAAARQGELSRKRKKGQRGPSGIPATGTGPLVQSNSGGAAAALAIEGATSISTTAAAPEQGRSAASATAAAAPSPAAASQSRSQGRHRGERPAAYNYVGAELRRIGVLATVAVAALVALSFVL